MKNNELFEVDVKKLQDFRVDIKHLLENIKDHYTGISIEEAVIAENVDNCIDASYSEIHFNTGTGRLEILMLGDGMSKDVFNELHGLAVTTKIGKGKLGRYGWGMKVMFFVAKQIKIETQKGKYHDAQGWVLFEGEPKWLKVKPTRRFDEDFTAIDIVLKDEYSSTYTPEFIERTLQELYPTLLGGLKLPDRGKLKFFINSKKVKPPQMPAYVKRKELKAKVNGERVGGYIFLIKEGVEKGGIDIIVLGRKIERSDFGVHLGPRSNQIIGYIHANVLWPCLRGDKTNIAKRTREWRELSRQIAPQLQKFIEEIGGLEKEEKLPKELMKYVHEQINKLISEFPELRDIATKPRKRKVLIQNPNGDIESILAEGSERVSGLFGGPTEGSGVPVASDELPEMAPIEKKRGDIKSKKVERRVKKGGVEIRAYPLDEEVEAKYFPGDGKVIVNSNFPTYRKAEKLGGEKTRAYHMIRCAIEALLEHAVKIGEIDEEAAKEYKTKVLARWGEM
ncbi:hypothetical protein DRP04_06935 [Archaeoglobales archaeon]|nr:MAG: hypothetical protein DRP04_06935 [Archaeoglobales archaeon]